MNKEIQVVENDNTKRTSKKTTKSKILVFLACFVLLTGLVSSCGGDSDSDKKESKSDATAYDISLIDTPSGMSIEPATLTVKSGENVVLNVTNDGTVPHNAAMDDGMKTADLAPYTAATLEIGTITEDTTVYCAIPGHKEAGMTMEIKVEN